VVGKGLATTPGTWNTTASFTYQWERCSTLGTNCTVIPGPVPVSPIHVLVAADAGHTLRAVVSATNAAGTTSAASQTTSEVFGVPHVVWAPRISGKAKVGRRLLGTHGTWSGPAMSYSYAWLRCSEYGTCKPIKKATHATYRLTKRDAGHRLRLRVTAVNAAGTSAASSRPSKTVSR
jgi:hypothetical protein